MGTATAAHSPNPPHLPFGEGWARTSETAPSLSYQDQGQHTVVMELEAFTVAAMDDTAEQQRDLVKYCMN